jgi:hypothetical protein
MKKVLIAGIFFCTISTLQLFAVPRPGKLTGAGMVDGTLVVKCKGRSGVCCEIINGAVVNFTDLEGKKKSFNFKSSKESTPNEKEEYQIEFKEAKENR